MDSSPIGYNPHIPPVSGPTGPSRTPGSQRRSVDSTQARPWQTSVPLMAASAPSALDLSALRDLTKHLAEADEDFATPMVLLASKIEESDNQKLLRNFSVFRKELFTLLTPPELRTTPAYLEVYRKFLGRYGNCSLCSSVLLKNSQGDEAKIDKLLICAASAVIDNAFETGWAECKQGIYLSDELNAEFFIYIVGFIKTGTFRDEPLPESLIALYTVALSQDMQDVIRYCQSKLNSISLDKHAFFLLWQLAEKYQDGFLKSFCLGLASQSEEILQSCPEELNKLMEAYKHVSQFLVLQPNEVEITTWNQEVMQFCLELNVKRIKISCSVPDIESLKQFKEITLGKDCKPHELLPGLLINNKNLTELICQADVKVTTFAEALAENQTLKTLSFRILQFSSDEERNLLAAALQKNLTLSTLLGLSQADIQWLRIALIEGPFERMAVLRF